MDLLDLSVYWNYGEVNEYLMHPVNANIEISKDKNPSPLTGSDPRFKVRVIMRRPNIRFSIFNQNLYFWPKPRFLTKISIFDENFDF